MSWIEDTVVVSSSYRAEVWNWCDENNIITEYQGTIPFSGSDVWYIENIQHLAWFKLKWA
jgi:hypothetical protein